MGNFKFLQLRINMAIFGMILDAGLDTGWVWAGWKNINRQFEQLWC
jgi:hypothetical protein